MIIVIATHQSTKPFLKDLLYSLRGCKYKKLVIENETTNSRYIANRGGYELGAMYKATTLANDDLFFLQDTCVIKKKKILEIAEKAPGGMALCHKFMSYLGKYKRAVLDTMVIPGVDNKQDSLRHEFSWTAEYISLDKDFQYAPDPLGDSNVFEEKHGRKNMVLENDYLIKYKARWG